MRERLNWSDLCAIESISGCRHVIRLLRVIRQPRNCELDVEKNAMIVHQLTHSLWSWDKKYRRKKWNQFWNISNYCSISIFNCARLQRNDAGARNEMDVNDKIQTNQTTITRQIPKLLTFLTGTYYYPSVSASTTTTNSFVFHSPVGSSFVMKFLAKLKYVETAEEISSNPFEPELNILFSFCIWMVGHRVHSRISHTIV